MPDALPHTIAAARRLRDGLPRAPLLAFLPEWPESPHRRFVRGLRSLPARAVLPGEPPPSLAELRGVVTSRAALLEDVSRWFRAHAALDPDELQAGLSLVAAGLEAAPRDPLPRIRGPGLNRGGGDPPLVAHAGQRDQRGSASTARTRLRPDQGGACAPVSRRCGVESAPIESFRATAIVPPVAAVVGMVDRRLGQSQPGGGRPEWASFFHAGRCHRCLMRQEAQIPSNRCPEGRSSASSGHGQSTIRHANLNRPRWLLLAQWVPPIPCSEGGPSCGSDF